ncbi:MAG: class I SAM-dependent methyltransferase [Bacteroidales bacterium]|nr:class I SAM-dependent methyltransferase [Bacteroidales bacterium]
MRAKLKAFFYALRLHIFIPSNIYLFLGNLAGLSRFVHKHKNDGMCDYYSSKFDYNKREELYKHVIDKFSLNDYGIDYLEFGVSKAVSFRWWVNKITNAESKFYGFDTFTGLPEDWGTFKAGDMSSENELPKIEDKRVSFYQGLFQQTLLPFLAKYNNEKRKVIHLDADLYSSTLYILTIMYPYLKPGDILLFDEFSVPMHEYKAFMEWTKSFYVEYEVLGSVNNFFRLAVMIK